MVRVGVHRARFKNPVCFFAYGPGRPAENRLSCMKLARQLRNRSAAVFAASFLSGLCFGGCETDTVLQAWDAQVRVNASYFAKLDQCDQSGPGFLILVPNDVQESDVRLCESELLASACPLNRIPGSCFLLLFKKARPDVESRF